MNKKRGSIHRTIDGVDREFALTTNAMVRYEEMAGRSFMSFVRSFDGGDFRVADVADLLAACSKDDLSRTGALDLMDEMGGLTEVMPLVNEVVEAAFPAEKTSEAKSTGGKTGKPRATT